METQDLEYVGFGPRVGAALLDGVWLGIITMPITYSVYGPEYWQSEKLIHGGADVLVNWIFPAIAVIAFWIKRQATPGKSAVSAKIVDARTGRAPSPGQCVGRYLGYTVASLPLGLGILWIVFDERKQGWHDKLAGTVVIRPKNSGPKPVSFE